MAGWMPRIVIDSSGVEAFGKELAQAVSEAGPIITSVLRYNVPLIVKMVLEEACLAAEPNFPRIYTEHVLSLAGTVPATVEFMGSDVVVNVDLDYLGTSTDLERAYHRHALLASLRELNGKGSHHSSSMSQYRLEDPYTGQELYNEEVEKRQEFWETLVEGGTYVSRGPKGRGVEINTAGMYDQTLIDRVVIWGNKAPEWLILEYGSHESSPYVAPQDVTGMMEEAIIAYGNDVYTEYTNSALQNIRSYTPRATSESTYYGGWGEQPMYSDLGKYQVRGGGGRFAPINI